MDLDIIHQFLSTESTWAIGISKETVQKSIQNSVCFAILYEEKLVAFARVITDKATFANLVDVFVVPVHRGKGLGRWLTQEILIYPEFQGLRRFTLATTTANGLYAKFGFEPVEGSKMFMQIYKPTIYSEQNISLLQAKL
ncbi:MAG: GNAT family N-acetyltransferase [Legionellales bacterium]|nr:GNAT family N-acetyltransferase [Legionellales bacterium]